MAVHHAHRGRTGGKGLVEETLEIFASALAVESDDVDFARRVFRVGRDSANSFGEYARQTRKLIPFVY